MKNDVLKWGALAAALVATASAEYELARSVGFNQWVAAAVPGALDIYTVRALRAHRDVLAAVLSLILVNSASHLVTVGLLPVDWPLVVAVAAIAPLVLWRVHRLADAPEETDALDNIQGTPDAPEYTEAEPVPAVPGLVPPIPPAVPEGARLLPIVARPAPVEKSLVPAAEYTRTRTEVHADWTVPGDYAPADEMPLNEYGLGLAAQQFKGQLLDGHVPSIRDIKARLSVGQARAKEIQDAFREALPRLAGSAVTS